VSALAGGAAEKRIAYVTPVARLSGPLSLSPLFDTFENVRSLVENTGA
jgi:hypothetical protein